MNDKKTWHEDESFWDDTQSIMFSKQRVENAPAEVDQILTLAPVKPEYKVLDLCCGIGRHTLELARRGYNMTAVDRKEQFINHAASIANEEKLNIEFVREDMRTFCRPDSFNIILNLFTSFGYFEDEADDLKVIQNISRSLKKGGFLLIDSMSKEILARIFVKRDWVEVDGRIILEERTIENNWSRVFSRWIIFDGSKRMEHTISLRLYSASEMKSLLMANGFSAVKFYGNLKGNPYDETAQRLVILAQK